MGTLSFSLILSSCTISEALVAYFAQSTGKLCISLSLSLSLSLHSLGGSGGVVFTVFLFVESIKNGKKEMTQKDEDNFNVVFKSGIFSGLC